MSAAAPEKTACLTSSTAPKISKLDPPSWWAGSTVNPIRLMIRGRNLQGARVKVDGAGVSCGAPKVSANGRYLFVDLKIAPKAAPGLRNVRIATPEGETLAGFEVLPNVSRKRKLPRLSCDDLIYLIMPDRFAQGGPAPADKLIDRARGRSYHGGNLQGVIDKLDYLKDLGVTALWLTPVYANADEFFPATYYCDVPFTNYHGYGPVDFYGVDRRLGDLKTLKALISKAQSMGLKVILDQVANHCSPQHAWVADPPAPDWFHGSTKDHVAHPFYHWMAADPYATEESKKVIMDAWLGDELPDLNQDQPEVARYLLQNMVWWAGVCGFDAWRHDSANYVPAAFWKKATASLRKEFPGFPNVSEINSDDPYLQAFYLGKNGTDACYDFPLRRAVRNVFIDGKSAAELPAALSRDALYSDPSQMITFAGLHDDPRFMGRPGATPEALALSLTLLLTTRGIPMVYYGDEIALAGGDDPDNRRDFPGGWPDDARDAFTDGGRSPAERAVFNRVRALARLRQDGTALRRGKLVFLGCSDAFYAYARLDAAESVVVVLNNGNEALEKTVAASALKFAGALKTVVGVGSARCEENILTVSVPAKEAAVFVFKRGKHG